MIYRIYRTAPFSVTLKDPLPRFQGHAILWRWVSQKRYEIHSFNGILIGTYTRPTQLCRFEWPWMILNDLAKYFMTRRSASGLCDSWASYFIHYLHSMSLLILVVLSRLDRGIQSATEMLRCPWTEGEGVAHSCNYPPPHRVYRICVDAFFIVFSDSGPPRQRSGVDRRH